MFYPDCALCSYLIKSRCHSASLVFILTVLLCEALCNYVLKVALLMICAILCAETKKEPSVHVDTQVAEETWTAHGTVWIVHFMQVQ